MKDKKGFMSISIIYSFLILFLLLLVSILASYANRINLVTSVVEDAKTEIYNLYPSSL